MDSGEALTRGTVWLALSLYVAGQIVPFPAGATRPAGAARILNTVGCAAFIAHVLCAFHFYHHWSHTAAYQETARQTQAYFNVNWGGGLYFNYAFLALWTYQVAVSWFRPAVPGRAGLWVTWILRSFVLMMIFNGAVVFARGPMRWVGLFLSLLLIATWLFRKR